MCAPEMRPNNAIHLTANSRLRRLLPAGDRGRWASRNRVVHPAKFMRHEREENVQRRSLVHTLVLTAGVALSALGNSAILAQQAPITRTILQQEDLAGVPGREVVMLRAEIAPGAIAAKHFHPGPEVVYILSGSLLVEPDGQPPVTLQEGDSMYCASEGYRVPGWGKRPTPRHASPVAACVRLAAR